MKTLKELVDFQRYTGQKDIDIIAEWFVANEMEQEALTLIPLLAKQRIDRIDKQLKNAQSWADTIPTEYIYKHYDLKTATMLHRIELSYIINGYVREGLLDWAKENIPNIDAPDVFYMPCLEWLEQQGIKFNYDKK